MLKNTIKNINLYQTNHKFNHNLFMLDYENYKFYEIPLNTSIHKYTFNTKNISKDSIFMFNLSIINKEILSFINNFYKKISIIIFVDKINELYSFINTNYPQLKQIVSDERLLGDNKVLIPMYLVNEQLYNNIIISDKEDQYIYFFDNESKNIKPELLALLYPNTNLPIKLFDSISIKHHQNIGFTTEIDKKNLLYKSKYYLFDNNNYLAEAALAGCHSIDINNDIQSQILSTQIDNQSIKSKILYYKDIVKDIFI